MLGVILLYSMQILILKIKFDLWTLEPYVGASNRRRADILVCFKTDRLGGITCFGRGFSFVKSTDVFSIYLGVMSYVQQRQTASRLSTNFGSWRYAQSTI